MLIDWHRIHFHHTTAPCGRFPTPLKKWWDVRMSFSIAKPLISIKITIAEPFQCDETYVQSQRIFHPIPTKISQVKNGLGQSEPTSVRRRSCHPINNISAIVKPVQTATVEYSLLGSRKLAGVKRKSDFCFSLVSDIWNRWSNLKRNAILRWQ
jgi:hypothetical protein